MTAVGAAGGPGRGCALDRLALERALTLLRTRFAEPLGVGDLADEAGYSRHHFGRGFTRDVGVAPGEYLAALRFAEAKRLLLGGGDAVLDVAVAVGFSSPSTFTRRFRAAVGTTPGGLRRVADSVADGTLPEFSLGDPARPRIRVRLRRPGGPPARPCRTWVGWYPRPVAVGLPAGGVLTRSDEAELPLCPGAPWLLAFTLDDAADPADELAPGSARDTALEWAAEIARCSPVGQRNAKKAMRLGADVDLRAGLEIEDACWRATAFSPAAFTASTSMPSTCSPGMPKASPRPNRVFDLVARLTEVPMAYWLFSITKMTGRSHSTAML